MRQLYYALGSGLAALQRHRPLGQNIYDLNWDICIILDSTRVDMLRDLLPIHFADYPAPPEIRSNWSVGSVTTEWLGNTFTPRYEAEIERTAIVSATPHSQTVFEDREYLTNSDAVRCPYPEPTVVDPSTFDGYYELWRSHAETHNVVPPETMRDATLEAYRDHERVVSHWMQPHEPFIARDASTIGADATDETLWKTIDDYNEDAVWQSYCANLSYALKHVRTVVENVDAKILITSDHGNAFGEWGVYGHPFGFPQPEVRKVPWVLIDGCALGQHEFDPVLTEQREDTNREEQLRALGYV